MRIWTAMAVASCVLYCSCGSKPSPTSTEDLIVVLASHKMADEYQIDGIRNLDGIGQSLFAHPKSQFSLPVPDDRHSVDFRFGIVDGATTLSPPTDGVEFRVLGNDPVKPIWSRQLRPTTVNTDRGTQIGTTAIPAGTKQLIFETLPVGGKLNNWAYWTGVSLK